MIIAAKLHFSVVALITPSFIQVWANESMQAFETKIREKWKECLVELRKHRQAIITNDLLHDTMLSKDVKFPYPPEAVSHVLEEDGLKKYKTAYHGFNCLQHVHRFVQEDVEERQVTLDRALTFCVKMSQCIVTELKTRCSQDALTFYGYKFRGASAQTPPKKTRKKKRKVEEGEGDPPPLPPKKRVPPANAN